MVKKLEAYAGVPHLKGDVGYNDALKKIVRSTPGARETSFGGFSALLDIQKFRMRHPLLVSTTDGVGTKLDLARIIGKHDTVGIDLVAMCVNDLITCGARPVLFLDYFAAGKFDKKTTLEVIRGIADGCRQAGSALLGGETAIMPDFYEENRYDLAGFSVGLVEKSKVIDGRKVKAGDVILGLESSGFHSNGYSLIRKVFTATELSGVIGRKLLAPTLIYVRPVLELCKKIDVHAIANITGGGLYDNLPRVLPEGLGAKIQKGTWPVSPLFKEVQKRANYSDEQMFHTFNMGVGMVVVVRKNEVENAKILLRKYNITSWEIGAIVRQRGVVIR